MQTYVTQLREKSELWESRNNFFFSTVTNGRPYAIVNMLVNTLE